MKTLSSVNQRAKCRPNKKALVNRGGPIYRFDDPSANSTAKSTRIKIVVKAMELGYTGIAYSRTIRGVMSDRDRCLIPLLPIAPFLSCSVNFHRDLLRVPISSPFRLYTRLTVCIDTASQSQALNSGNPVLKTYDIVAVRSLNQNTFDHACEKAEVDIISIDLSDKLPFRLKLPMVKAAFKRGVRFEIAYSDLIVDAHRRGQMISNAKLMLDRTRGKSIIFSSAAPSVCEVEGPNDVANLASLLGLSMERAKAAISKNCRNLLTNALIRKHFFKEAIRVEPVSYVQPSDSETPCPWPAGWLKWDPISSGEGDLLLDDMAKSFSASNNVSKTVKPIDFDSIIDKIPSHGFQVKDLISGTEASSQPPTTARSFSSTPEPIELSVTNNWVFENSIKLDLLPEKDDALLDNTCSEH
ncbi:protein GAMETOPHYTE DEFECTIVE 1-like [Hibiscus syriacus]|uniref:protein GAMETOPHYTE DEFECTIVE 1-like n=1 Tax=Hibiscus syriacus TaxID=106335 RepID=UPI001923A906|nr:protein GAMETOPHYTE DEFECTIVE 1-like [Hibiscus syriacus]